jgi:hypothetical protein
MPTGPQQRSARSSHPAAEATTSATNDTEYMGDNVNRVLSNVLGAVYLVVLLVVAAITIPLMIATKAGT